MFIENLQRLMQENGVSKRRLAREMGFGINRIRYWEKHGNIPSADVLVRLARYFGVSAESLLEDPVGGKVSNSDISDISDVITLGSGKNSDVTVDIDGVGAETSDSRNGDGCGDTENSDIRNGGGVSDTKDSDIHSSGGVNEVENSDTRSSGGGSDTENSDTRTSGGVDDTENSDSRKMHIRFLTDDEWLKVLRLRSLNKFGQLKAAEYLDELTKNTIYTSKSMSSIKIDGTFGDSDVKNGGTRTVRTAAHDGSFGTDDGFKARALPYSIDDLEAIKSLDDVDDLD